MAQFVRDLSPAEKLTIYKKVKGFCLWEGIAIMDTMKNVLDDKVKDVVDNLDYDIVDHMESYKDYTHNRFGWRCW